jgi:hypothetical protein
MADTKHSEIAEKILQYLHCYPRAMDSVEGIARWWVKADELSVGEALDELTAMKVVGKRKGVSHDLYFLSDGHLQS